MILWDCMNTLFPNDLSTMVLASMMIRIWISYCCKMMIFLIVSFIHPCYSFYIFCKGNRYFLLKISFRLLNICYYHFFMLQIIPNWPAKACVFFGGGHTEYSILVPQPGIEPVPPAMEAQRLNHWTTTKKVLVLCPFDTAPPVSEQFLAVWHNMFQAHLLLPLG